MIARGERSPPARSSHHSKGGPMTPNTRPGLRRALGALCIAVVILAGCGSEPPTAGDATAFSAVCERANDGRRVAVDGYLIFPESFSDSQSVVLRLHETDAF